MRLRSLSFVLCLSVCLASAVSSVTAGAQSDEAGLKTRLLKKPMYLRQQYRENSLLFGPAGELQSVSPVGPFTLGVFDIRKVEKKSDRLVLEGARKGLELYNEKPVIMTIQVDGVGAQVTQPGELNSHRGTASLTKAVGSSSSMLGNEQFHFEIMQPASGDYDAALSRIFATSLADLTASVPVYWQRYARKHFISPAQNMEADATLKPGGNVTAPMVLKMPREVYTTAARALKYGGDVVVAFHVEKSGKATHVEIIKALGLGLDEEALTRIQQTTFKPAMQDGVPVVVQTEMKLEFKLD